MTGASTSKAASDLFSQAVDSFESALKAGVRIQEDSLKWWTDLATQPPQPSEWPERARSFFQDVIPKTTEAAQESLKTFDQISKSSLETLKQAMGDGTKIPDPQVFEQVQQLWEETLKALRKNAETLLEKQASMVSAWTKAAESVNGSAKKDSKKSS